MMRDDVLKRKMRAAMPMPTPLFTGRVRQTLDRLPERKRILWLKYVPVAAMTMVAVAVIGLAVMSRMDPGGVNNWFQALAGEEATATIETTPAPTPEPQATEDASLETVIPTETPMETVEVTDTPMPTPAPEATEVTDTIMPNSTDAAPSATPGSGEVLGGNSIGTGKIAFGNDAHLVEIRKINKDFVWYVVEVKASDELQSLFDNSEKTKNCVTLEPPTTSQFSFIIVKGQVDSSFIRDQVGYETIDLMLSAGDDWVQKGVFVRDIKAEMERLDNGNFRFNILNCNPNYRPLSNFTIITRSNDGSQNGHYYALPVTAK